MEAVAHKPWCYTARVRSQQRFRCLVGGESPGTTRSQVTGSGQECPLYTVSGG